MPTDSPTIQVELLVAAVATGGACSVFNLHGPPGAVVPPHRRRDHDVALVLVTGAAAVRIDDEERRLGPGDVAWLPRAAACRLELLAATRLLCFVLPAGFENLASGPGRAAPDADDLAVLLGLAGVALLPSGWGARPTLAQ